MPDSNVLSVPFWLLTTLHIVTLTLHFVAMNFVVGSLAVILWGKFTNKWEHPVVKQVIGLLPSAIATTVTLGVAPLLFTQAVYYREIYSASIVSGWFWLSIVPVVIVVYSLCYRAAFSRSKGKTQNGTLWIALAGLIYVSFIYSSVFSLAEHMSSAKALYAANQSGFQINPNLNQYIFRWLHMVFGAITVGGFFVGWLGRNHDDAYKMGKFFFLWGMAAASLIGFIYLVTLGELLVPFMRTPGIWALTLGIVMSAGSLHFFFKKKFSVAGSMILVSLLSMVTCRHYVRLLNLGDSFKPESLAVDSQWSVFAIFLVCLILAAAIITWMLKSYFKSAKLKH